ncbi:MAG: hypothetical protein Q4A58_03860 [Fusobacterium sp.]|uniref:hypothetical protein n=1 Tax=Fusobacterium sp. TaxID=68766 RepID=UPI0026DDBEC6|nr:hypothetical protein [Fusobacterium sp.]MDO4690413.1 hypothetical protein [Fusobacterium sp.]
MKRFQNASLEYNAQKRELIFRDAQTNGIFFAIEFFENKQMKRVFSLYPLSVELKDKMLELKFSVENENSKQNVLTMFIETTQLSEDKRTIIDVSVEDLDDIIFS